mgnify:CR=1 FL=1
MTTVQKAQENFGKMLETCYSSMTVENFANGIRALVQNNETTWDELGFTDSDVAERLRKAKVREAAENFGKMLETCYSSMTVENFANGIRALVQNNETTWDELGFTDSDVAERLRKAKVREAA